MAAILFTFEETIIYFSKIKLQLAFFAPLQENIVEDNRGKQYFYSFLFRPCYIKLNLLIMCLSRAVLSKMFFEWIFSTGVNLKSLIE